MIIVKLALSLSFEGSKQHFIVMKNTTQKSIKWLSIAILFLATVTVASIYWQMISQLWLNPAEDRVVWKPEGLTWQICIIAGRFAGVTLLYLFCWIFLIRTNRALDNGEIFPKSNIALIRWTALVSALTTFVHSNYSAVVEGDLRSTLDSNTIFVPLIILLFAGLYKMAYLAAKDSNLAI